MMMGFLEGIMRIFTPEDSSIQARDVGRNEQCWCGSGKKYKKCHLAEDEKKMRRKSSLQCGRS
jgi:uncharacterized protein YecA (UPF0149 family)